MYGEQNHQYSGTGSCDNCRDNSYTGPKLVPGSVDIGNRGDKASERV